MFAFSSKKFLEAVFSQEIKFFKYETFNCSRQKTPLISFVTSKFINFAIVT